MPGNEDLRGTRLSDVLTSPDFIRRYIPIPERIPPPGFAVDLIRPDDLLNLRVAGYNLKVNTDADTPYLGLINANAPAYLVVTFPPQHIAERAFYEKSPVQPILPPGTTYIEPPDETPLPPGQVPARISHPSRLVFRVPPEALPVAYTLEGLLDWSAYELCVSPIADLPPKPTNEQIRTAPAVTPPHWLETAIELPYRMIISPDHNVAWQHRIRAVAHLGRVELWHTRMALRQDREIHDLSLDNKAALRAIWSPDFTPTNPPPSDSPDTPGLGRSALSSNDRYQLVRLTSDYASYHSDHVPPIPPEPFYADRLILSPLGGWLRSRGAWDLPQQAGGQGQPGNVGRFKGAKFLRLPLQNAVELKPELIDPNILIPPVEVHVVPDDLSITEWLHNAAQGRDQYVQVVYDGHLCPTGHRASLVKVTERRFAEGNSGGPVAYLIQYNYIIVREKEKVYADGLYHVPGRHKGLEMPTKKIRLTTLVTPHIIAPDSPVARIPNAAHKKIFWIMDNATGQDFKFHAIAEDVGGHSTEILASLIFVERGAAEAGAIPTVQTAYKGAINNPASGRAFRVDGHPVSYAQPNGDPSDNTTLTTQALYMDIYTNGPAEFGGFLPFLDKADVKIPAIEQLLGKDAPTTIKLFDNYLNNGFDANAGVFAELVDANKAPKKVELSFSADKAGGISTPNMQLTSLSRAYGPLAGNPMDSVIDKFDPTQFFGGFLSDDLLPKLFGSISLAKLLPLNSSLGKNAPKLQITTEAAPNNNRKIVATMDWLPDIQAVDAGLISFAPNAGSKLEIRGRVEKLVALPTPTNPPALDQSGTFSFNGELTDFTVEIFKALVLNFAAFTFTAGSGRKTDVDVQLREDKPFEFKGDLEFINDLTHLIPAGALGDGPSLDISPTQIHVGYGIVLPPATIGVFTMKNLSFAAGLTLPFLNGKPEVDFSFASRHQPFCLTVSLLGGGGFVHLQLNTEVGMRLLEVALEFGASADLDIGVASGSVHVFAGIYFSMQNKNGKMQAVLAGYMRMGGELSVLGLISVSVEFNLTFSYDTDTEKVSGRATLTVSVKVAFFSKSVELSVERSFGRKGGDPDFAMLITGPNVWADYAEAFA